MYFLKYSLYSIFLFFAGVLPNNIVTDNPQLGTVLQKKKHFVSRNEVAWVDSVYNSLTLEERIAQTMMIRAHSDKGPEHIAEVERLIKTYNVGSLCFFQGTAEKQAALTNQYQAIAKTALIIAIDAEWGLGMRLKETTISFPKNLALGGIQDNKLVYEYGRQLAFQCKRLGIHMNFAPAVDINNNAKNPVINDRSFGENRYNVSGKSYQLMMGLQDENIIACAKHFPGHGDTDVDSHLDLPSILHNRKRIDSLELYPFRVLIQHDIQSIMVAHLQIPCLDTAQNLPTTLSPKVVTQLLKDQLCYEGLIVTDALEMKGISKYFKNGEIEAKALLAGNDVLCLPGDVTAAITAIKSIVETGELPMKRIEESVKKILHAKYRLGLNDYKPIVLENIDVDLNNDEALALKRQLIEKSIITVRNNDHLIPITTETSKIATLAIGSSANTTFQQTVDLYRKVDHFNCPRTADSLKVNELLEKLKPYPLVIVSTHEMTSKSAQNYNLNERTIRLIEALQRQQKVILSVFGNPYALRNFDSIQNVLLGWSEDAMAQSTMAQVLFGAIGTDAKLPVTASAAAKYGMGEKIRPNQTIAYDRPENVGVSASKLKKVDSLVWDAIAQKAMPGAVVLVAKDGKIIYQKAFGNKTFDSIAAPMSTASVFDLASITKMAATTLAVMKLQEQGQLDLDAPISTYLSSLKSSNKASLTLRELMTHHAGLTPWIPFYKKTLTDSTQTAQPSEKYYRTVASDSFSIPVANQLFLRSDYQDTLWERIVQSPLLPTKAYKYSDLGLIITGKIIESVTKRTLNDYIQETFYTPLGINSTGFKPLDRMHVDSIVPSEADDYFRKQVVRGYVHDMAAAMTGGVSGHAGLFSNANDLAVIMQLLLNNGYYGGKAYLKPETVQRFTTRLATSTRRGIGFDMKELDTKATQNMCAGASEQAFGHLGFTGTVTWADPAQKLVYVFLSNRTYPTMNNNKLIQMDTRIKVHQAIYDALKQ